MKLFFHPFSQPSRTTYAVALHLGLPVETQLVQLGKGEQKTPEFLAMNPNGKVPTLQDGDFCLWESLAIQAYFCEKAQDTSLWPKDSQERAKIEQWRLWSLGSWSKTIAVMAYNRLFKKAVFKQEPDMEAVAQAEKDFVAPATLLNNHLESREWMCLDRLTLADFALASMLTHKDKAGIPLDEFPHIQAWYSRMGELEAWKKTEPVWPK